MKFGKNNKYFQWGLTAFLVIVAGICFYYLMFHGVRLRDGLRSLGNILMPVVFGLSAAYILTPVLNFFEGRIFFPLCNRVHIKETKRRNTVIRVISVFLSVSLLFFLIYSLIAMLISQIVPSVLNIVNNFDKYADNFINWLNKLLAAYPDVGDYIVKTVDKYSVELESWLNNILVSRSSELIKRVSLGTINSLKILLNIVIGLIISIYLLSGKEKFSGQAKKVVYALFSRDTANIIINNFRFTNNTFIGFLGGKVADSIIIGLFCFIGVTLMQLPYAALVSVIIGVTNIIPFFGPFLGAVPSILLIFIVDPTHPLKCLYFIIFIFILQQFDGNVLGPKILGESTGLSGFWVIFAITLFGGLFGILGMIIGVPIFAVIYAAVRSYVNARLHKKNMSQLTEDYIFLGTVDDNGYHKYIPDYRLDKNARENSLYGKNFISNAADLKEQMQNAPSAGESKIEETASSAEISKIAEEAMSFGELKGLEANRPQERPRQRKRRKNHSASQEQNAVQKGDE